MDEVDAIVQAIAKKHGVVLGKDDPVLMLHTFMECFFDTLARHQEEERIRLVSALEMEQQKWSAESKARAERIVATSLEEARKSAVLVCEQAGDALMTRFNNALAEKLAVLEQKQIAVYRLAVANALGAALLAVAGVFLWASRY